MYTEVFSGVISGESLTWMHGDDDSISKNQNVH